jgi:hypothetical protein
LVELQRNSMGLQRRHEGRQAGAHHPRSEARDARARYLGNGLRVDRRVSR